MRLKSGVTDQYIYFVAVDSTDLKTRETGLSSFTVYRSRDGAAAAAMTTPTINEVDATNMPGVYELLVDEDTTLTAGNDSEEMVFHITHTGMAPVTRVIEIYRTNVDAISGDATAADNLESDYDGTGYNKSNSTIGTVTTNTDLVSAASIADAVWDELQSGHVTAGSFGEIATEIAEILIDTGTTLPATLATIDTNVDSILADTGTDGVIISTTTANQIADALLNRDMSAVSVTNSRSPINALRFLRNKWSVSGSTLTVTEEDDTTSAWTSTLTSDAAADPVTGSDPA